MNEGTEEEIEQPKNGGVKFMMCTLAIVILFSLIAFLLSSLGFLGRTVVEREVFENSYQKQSADKTRIAIYEAQLIELRSRLALDPNNQDLRDQVSMVEARARAARILQEN